MDLRKSFKSNVKSPRPYPRVVRAWHFASGAQSVPNSALAALHLARKRLAQENHAKSVGHGAS